MKTPKRAERLTADNAWYRFQNLNPRGLRTGDCATRAVARALACSWEEAARFQLAAAIDNGYGMDTPETVNAILVAHGFAWVGVGAARPGSSRLDARRFALAHREGVYVLRLAGHVTAVVDGIIRDTWDCGRKTIYGWWQK